MPERSELKKRGVTLKPTIQVGKTGFSVSIKEELRSQLEKKELVKLKVLQSMGPSGYWKEELEKTVESIGAKLIETKGRTALVYKRSSKNPHSKSRSSK
jgi:RNA-binding protein